VSHPNKHITEVLSRLNYICRSERRKAGDGLHAHALARGHRREVLRGLLILAWSALLVFMVILLTPMLIIGYHEVEGEVWRSVILGTNDPAWQGNVMIDIKANVQNSSLLRDLPVGRGSKLSV